MNRAVLLILLLLASCRKRDNSASDVYGYVFYETTGRTQHILKDKKVIAVEFKSNSDLVAESTLDALDFPVLYANGDGKNIFVVGKLDEKILWTPDDPHMAQSEPYQEFRLDDWYILTPFQEYTVVNQTDLELKKERRSDLRPDDFGIAENVIKRIDLSRFQKKHAS